MVQVSYPGIYTLEVPSGVRSISGVSTSIAAFVGMAKRGPLGQPTRILGFQDYERVFSTDASLGEMTDQIRQFFVNGGEVAFVVRIADGALQASASLPREFGPGTALTLLARDAGLDGTQLRARVDYDTPSPERTFNLTVYRERFDASGLPVIESSETFTDLGMLAGGSRYVQTIVNQESQLARVDSVTPGTAINAFSASASLHADDTAAEAAIEAAILAANPSGTTGRFTIRVGSTPTLTVQLDSTDPITLTTVQDAINGVLAQHTTVEVAVTMSPATNGSIRIAADTTGHDVVIGAAAQLDIAKRLGLGAVHGGVEVGTHAPSRPAPAGLVSRLDNTAGAVTALLNFGAATKASLTSVGVGVVRPFTVLAAAITYPSGAGNLNEGTRSVDPSLLNVRENLEAIANAMSAGSNDWRAVVHGLRLVLLPRFGDASAGAGATFVSVADLTAADQIYEGVTGRRAAEALGGGTDGAMPQPGDYDQAYARIDEQVDLFNLLVLPRSFEDTPGPASVRSTLWGAASAFCQRKRAFLLVDAEPVQETTEGMLAAIGPLRNGVAKDHAAVYWPRVTINAGGVRKHIDPSGSIAGLMSRIDGSRGVWKAPAGLEGDLRGVLGVSVALSDTQNGLLNPQAINVIRSFPNGIVSWGARTMDGFDNSGNTDYRYVPPRRLALFIEESLIRGLRFAVFEPNDEPLWGQIRLAAGAFMNGLFRRGAFAGRTASDAYFIKADDETTTQTDINLGIVNVLIGFAPVKPAEFIVIRLQQKAGQVQV
jgi:uncharacterized protein